MKCGIAAACLLVGIGLLTQGASAQQPQDDTVMLTVQVADSAGQAVVDLQSKDFGVWEDSIAQEIKMVAKGDTDGSYVISYLPAPNQKIGFRKIEVKVRMPDLRVSAKSGYDSPAQK